MHGQNDPITIRTTASTQSAENQEIFPAQSWPTTEGHFKALVMLSPGLNVLTIKHGELTEFESQISIRLTHIPLLQYPPLHLAIMTAKDSPLMVDCPLSKGAGLSSAHMDLDAVVAKFRMTAYMWQAMTAEDMRMKGLGRRSFRLDEEWGVDTVSCEFVNAKYNGLMEYAMR